MQRLRGIVAMVLAGTLCWPAVHGEPVVPVADVLTEEAVQSCPAAEPGPPQDPATTSSIPGGDRFSARDHFREDVSPRSAVKISWLGGTFRQRFVSKYEEAPARTTLRAFAVGRSVRGAEIVGDLGARRETTLGELWCLLAGQPAGERGLLITTAIPNLLFIRDGSGVLWIVDVVWGGAGWEIGASSIDGDLRWPAGIRVITH